MTIDSQTLRDDYTGNGVASTFAFNYKILSSADLKVIKKLIASPYTETTLALTTDYTVSGVGETDGSITLVAGALPSTYTLHILVNPSVTQDASFRDQARFSASTNEDAFDSLLNVSKRVKRTADASIRIPESEDPSSYPMTLSGANTRANKIVGFDSSGLLDLKDSGDVDDLTAEFAATNTYTNATVAALNTSIQTSLGLKADKTITITATAPITGGGNMSANMTIGVSNANTSNAGVVVLAADGNTSANAVVQGSDSRLQRIYVLCSPAALANTTVFPVIPCESGSVSVINTSLQTAMVGSNGSVVVQLVHLGNMAVASNIATVSIPVNTTSINTSFNATTTNTAVGMSATVTAVGNTTAGTNLTMKVK